MSQHEIDPALESKHHHQKPSLGRIVHYKPTVADGIVGDCAALITKVWSETCVNLRVMPDGGPTFFVISASHGYEAREWHWPDRV